MLPARPCLRCQLHSAAVAAGAAGSGTSLRCSSSSSRLLLLLLLLLPPHCFQAAGDWQQLRAEQALEQALAQRAAAPLPFLHQHTPALLWLLL